MGNSNSSSCSCSSNSSSSSSSSSSSAQNEERPPCACPDNNKDTQGAARDRCSSFQMPLQYPRYKKADYETMEEWKLDFLFAQYGLPIVAGDVEAKKEAAMRTFLWN